jgi:hypothetical protein
MHLTVVWYNPPQLLAQFRHGVHTYRYCAHAVLWWGIDGLWEDMSGPCSCVAHGC